MAVVLRCRDKTALTPGQLDLLVHEMARAAQAEAAARQLAMMMDGGDAAVAAVAASADGE